MNPIGLYLLAFAIIGISIVFSCVVMIVYKFVEIVEKMARLIKAEHVSEVQEVVPEVETKEPTIIPLSQLTPEQMQRVEFSNIHNIR